MSFAKRLRCLIALSLLAASAQAADVVLVASPFPKELLSAYKKAFDAHSAQYRVEFVNFPATHILSFLHDRAAGSRPDVFWGSSPDAFRTLRRNDLLEPLHGLGNADIPARSGRIQINDPEGFTLGQALSGYGIMWNTRYLAARGLTPPSTWEELADARYFGHVVMSSPSRSSTTHLIFESILQGKGWNAGWSLILRMAGNAATITERSFDVPNNITRGRFGVGPVVDFLALSGKYSGFPVDFRYPSPNVVTPASIGLIKGARNPEGGRAFIAFALSDAGQRLLLRPEISRLPVLPSVYDGGERPADFPDLSDLADSTLPEYAPDISEARYRTVNALFDQMITFRHRDLIRVTKAIHRLEEKLSHTPDAQARLWLERASALAYRPPIDAADAILPGQTRQGRDASTQMATREAEWSRQRARDLLEVQQWIDRAEARMDAAR